VRKKNCREAGIYWLNAAPRGPCRDVRDELPFSGVLCRKCSNSRGRLCWGLKPPFWGSHSGVPNQLCLSLGTPLRVFGFCFGPVPGFTPSARYLLLKNEKVKNRLAFSWIESRKRSRQQVSPPGRSLSAPKTSELDHRAELAAEDLGPWRTHPERPSHNPKLARRHSTDEHTPRPLTVFRVNETGRDPPIWWV